jgi:hypothetical protein
MKRKLRARDWVRGLNSPFVHGQIETIDGAFARLTDESVYPLISLKKATKQEVKNLPDFVTWTKNSKNGLGLF